MPDEKPKQQETENKVAIINRGPGSIETAHGKLLGNGSNSLDVPESYAAKLCGAYRHVVLLSSISKSSGDVEALRAENQKLQKQLADLEKSHGEKVDGLHDVVREFLEADKKDLPALQEKHADAVPAKETAGAAS